MPGEDAHETSSTAAIKGQEAATHPVSISGAADKVHDVPQAEPPEADEFGLPQRPPRRRQWTEEDRDDVEEEEKEEGGGEKFEDAPERPESRKGLNVEVPPEVPPKEHVQEKEEVPPEVPSKEHGEEEGKTDGSGHIGIISDELKTEVGRPQTPPQPQTTSPVSTSPTTARRARTKTLSQSGPGISEWSHQQMAPHTEDEGEEEVHEGEWQAMPAFATHRIYDDWGKVLAKEYDEVEDEHLAYGTLGGAGKGYTRVQVDDDAESATSMDDNTAYLFPDQVQSNALTEEDDEGRDLVSQMQTTKELLTEGQRIAYVGVVRLSIGTMTTAMEKYERTRHTKKQIEFATEAMKMWGQKMMVRLYSHMEIDSSEQVMVEQLADHGVLPVDLTPALMQNARVRNPAKVESETVSLSSARPSTNSPRPSTTFEKSKSGPSSPLPSSSRSATPPPEYRERAAEDLTVEDPSQIENAKNLDLDLRWTVLCDLFLLLIADSTYDARSRTLLELVGTALSVDWTEICRFEKRVTDALEMQEQADKENWNEEEHLEARKKRARNKRLMMMGLCTVGGGLVIGLSAGLLAPVIGAGLAAGFTSIGVAGTSTFLGGTGAAALIGGGGALTGGVVAVKAANRRTGAVKTFEYRPLFNSKRPNLIVTIAGWMTGKVDDVRLPFSTVNPVMGDIYSVNWEPDMLQSTGQTIQILATEALTQTIQQIVGAGVLGVLMSGLSLPIVLTKLSYLIDNPWTVSLARADATGLILADSLIDRNLGVRPITLVGFSLGSRVIFSCLKELVRRGALGLVQNVYLFGSPVVVKPDEWLRARTVVSGRFVNGYATNDWILGYLFRATSGGIMRISGLASVDVPGIENKDVTELVPGHMAYRAMMPTLLQEVGWLVDGLEFSEIEDPDPDNHEKRQRELIDEIEAARKELDEKLTGANGERKRGFKAFFARKKAVQKSWETYDERSQKVLEGDEHAVENMNMDDAAGGVMFDVDAIRQEALKLALEGTDIDEIKQHLQIREIESTMPALKISSAPPATAVAVAASSSQPAGGGLSNGILTKTRSLDDSRPASSPLPNDGRVPSNTAPDDRNGLDTPSKPSTPDPSLHHRPVLRSAATTPVITTTALPHSPSDPDSPDHNPWMNGGHREEHEFGREGDVSMSFE